MLLPRAIVSLLIVVQLGRPNPLEICSDDLTKYMLCIQSEYGKELKEITAFDESEVQSELSNCFIENKCVVPPEYKETPPADNDPDKSQPTNADESSHQQDDSEAELPEPFETKTVLSERAFPGAKSQEFNKTMSLCLQAAEEEQKKALLTCMQTSLVGFKYPKDGGGIPRIQDFVDSAMRGLTTRRTGFEVEANTVYYHLQDIKGTCKAWRKVDDCLRTVIRKGEDSSYDLVSKSESMRDSWCKIHGVCLKSSNSKCHKLIESLRQIECDCLRKGEKDMVKAIDENYAKCLGYGVKRSLIEAQVADTMEAVCGAESAPPECSKI